MSITATQIAHWRTWIGKTEIREEVLDTEALRRFAAALGESLDVEAMRPRWRIGPSFLPVAAAAPHRPGRPPQTRRLPAACQPAAPHVCRRADGIWRGAGAGLPATRTSTIRDVAHKAGRSGDLVLLEVEHRIEQAGALCVAERQTIVYRDAGAPTPAPVPASVPPQGDVPWNHTASICSAFPLSPSTATASITTCPMPPPRGYPGLVVHGPFTACRLYGHARPATAPGPPVCLPRGGAAVLRPAHRAAAGGRLLSALAATAPRR
jgi:3-methylfumaryl-CoA hydratase